MIEFGDIISFTTRGAQHTGLVESVYTCAADGRPTEFEPDETRYFVMPIIAGEVQPGHMLVMPSDNPVLVQKSVPVEVANFDALDIGPHPCIVSPV